MVNSGFLMYKSCVILDEGWYCKTCKSFAPPKVRDRQFIEIAASLNKGYGPSRDVERHIQTQFHKEALLNEQAFKAVKHKG